MDPRFEGVTVKSAEEIIEQLAEILHRHRRSYLRKFSRACPNNCAYADVSTKRGVTGCGRCDSSNPEQCRQETLFVPVATKEEIMEQFRQDIRNPNVLRHQYRDVMSLLWVLGQFDGERPEEEMIARAEKRDAGKGK